MNTLLLPGRLERVVDNPFNETSRSHRLFEVLANADRPLSAEAIAAAVGEAEAGVAHSMLKDLRSRGFTLHRYRDPDGSSPTASVYSLRPVEGFTELSTQSRPRAPRASSTPPVPVQLSVRQPTVGAVARVTALLLDGEDLHARFVSDDVVYEGDVSGSQPSVGEWLTLVTVSLHGQGLAVDLAGSRVVTVQNITEVNDAG